MSFLLYFIIAFVLTLFFIYFFKFKFIDNKNYSKLHFKRLGGLIIALVFLLLLSFSYFLGNEFQILAKDFWSILGVAVLIIVFGLLDDKYRLSPFLQLLVHILIVLVFLFAGDFINHVHLPFFGLLVFPTSLKYLITFVWILVIINAFNWFDGMDGLAGGVGFITFLTLFFLSLSSIVNQPNTAFISIILSGAVLGFLYFNFYPAKVYLGSVGSWLIGSMIALLSIYSGGKVATAALVLGIPILDFMYVAYIRTANGKKPWQGEDRLHLHFKLEDAGFSRNRIILLMYCLSISLGFLALTFQTNLKIFGLFILAMIFIWLTLKYRL
ncbi:MAG: hypothetical protein GF347_02655 [Candidatus Moranbacteria bacterium]|nr:hypothetical protein [Candidatus Moranbacteria bacterium]